MDDTSDTLSHIISNKLANQKKVSPRVNLNLPWIEKYRPSHLDDMIDHEEKINTLKNLIKNNELPHLLFYGPPGTGKTSLILAAAREMYGDDYRMYILELNASDDRGIDIVRNKIPNFIKTKSDKLRLVILDEADAMTQDAQSALRRVMEMYVKTSRFCLICNNINKIVPGIQSRCSKMRFGVLNVDEVKNKVRHITNKERVNITDEAIKTLISVQRDFRQILNILQCLHYIRLGEATNLEDSKEAGSESKEAGSESKEAGSESKEEGSESKEGELADAKGELVDAKAELADAKAVPYQYTPIDVDDIYTYLGKPCQKEIDDIINKMFNKPFHKTFKYLQEIFRENRWNILDLITNLSEQIINKDTINENQRFFLLQKLSKIEYRIVTGRDSEIQLAALIASFKKANTIK